MSTSLFINGAFKDTLEEIEKTQHDHPGKLCYLQPYSSRRITLLAESVPTPENPIALYLSLTDSLGTISYRAKIVGWQDKRTLEKDQLTLLNQHIKEFQPSENEIYPTIRDGKPCVNLISVIDVEPVEPQFSVSRLIKMSDGTPLRAKTTAGGWSPVREQRLRETVLEVGTEGGSIALLREREAGADWQFQIKTDETALYDALSEEDREGVDFVTRTEYVQSFDEALGLLDSYPWFRLHPLEVHPEFVGVVLREVKKRAAQAEERRWREALNMGGSLQREDGPRMSAGKESTTVRETVVKVGAEGGSITLSRERNAGGDWEFQMKTNETTLYDVLSEEDRNSIGEYFAQTGYVRSFHEGILLLDKYPWFGLHPLEVHPEFLDAVLREVKKRGGPSEERRWRETLNRSR